MPDFRNKEGSTGYLKDGKFEPFASQAEADGEAGDTEQEEAAPAKSARSKKQPADESN